MQRITAQLQPATSRAANDLQRDDVPSSVACNRLATACNELRVAVATHTLVRVASNWTRWGYASDWRAFAETCRERWKTMAGKNPEDVEPRILAVYLRWLRTSLAPASVKRATYGILAHLRTVRPERWTAVPPEVRQVLDELREAVREHAAERQAQ